MKKVLFTATVNSHILAFHLPFLKFFKEKGYEVHVATNKDGVIPYCDKLHVIPFERSPFKKNNLKAIKKLQKVLEEERFFLVHTNTPMGSVVTRLAYKKMHGKKPKIIYMAHGLHFYKGANIKNWLLYYPVEKYLSKFTDTLILINQEDYELCKRKFKKCKNIEYVPGVGIDQKKFAFDLSLEEKKQLRASLGLKMNDFVLIYPAELNQNKNQIFLIKAMQELVKIIPNIHLLLPGTDSNSGLYQKKVSELDLKEHIHFLGFRKDIPKLLKISNLSVATSKREGLAVNIMEAMTSKIPVIATDVRGQRDLITNGKTGFLVSLDDIKTFISYVKKLYYDKELYTKMQKNCQKESEKFRLEIILEKMQKIYEQKWVVMHLLASNSFSGAENVVCTIIDSTKEEYEHYYCSTSGKIKSILEEKNIHFCPLEKFNYQVIKRKIKEINPDIIHAHDFKSGLMSSIVPKPKLLINHLHQNPTWIKKKNLKSMIYRNRSKKFDKIIIVSEAIEKEYVYRNKILHKCYKVPNYVDKENVIKLSKESYKKKYDVAFFGRIIYEKQPEEFLAIIKEYEKKYKPVKACFIGDGNLINLCQSKIKEWRIKSTIDFLGFQKNPFKIIKNCECVIMPSLYEGFGLTAIESMLLDVPVLNSGVGGLKEIFTQNSWYICQNKEEYIKKMYNILEKKEWPKIDLKKYTNRLYFKEKIEKIYEE